jgi:hypothetical protein
VAQRPGASAAHGQLRIRMAGLCYDTQPVEAMPLPVDILDKTLCALLEDFYQENLLYKPLVERFRRNICLLETCIQEKSPLQPVVSCWTQYGRTDTEGPCKTRCPRRRGDGVGAPGVFGGKFTVHPSALDFTDLSSSGDQKGYPKAAPFRPAKSRLLAHA